MIAYNFGIPNNALLCAMNYFMSNSVVCFSSYLKTSYIL